MKRSFKSFKLPKAIRRVFALLLVCGVFAVAGLAYATGENNSMDRDSIIESLGQANNFAVFAKNFTNDNHMEGSIAVENLLGASSNLGNTNLVYNYDTEESDLNITIEKTVTKLKDLKKSFNIGIYQKNTDNSYTLIDTVTIKTDANGKGSANVDTSKLDSNTKYYFFEIDGENNPITGDTGVIGGQEYTVSISSSSSSYNVIDTPAYGVGNTSYIENFKGGGNGVELFQGNSYQKATVVIGKGNQYSINGGQIDLIGVDGSQYRLGTTNNVNVIQAEDSFPIDFTNEFNNLINVSKNLATLTDSTEIKVINVPIDEDGNIDYKNIKSSDGTSIGINDQNDWKANKGLTTDGKLLIVNFDCTKAPNEFEFEGPYIDKKSSENWDNIANSVIYNFYTKNGNSYGTYNGKINIKGLLGTALAPSATITCKSSTNGSVIADTVNHAGCEIHHIKLINVSGKNVTNYKVSVTNTPTTITDKGSLKIEKKIKVNNSDPLENNTYGNGTYYFDILNEDKSKVVTTATVTVSNGISGTTTVGGLEPGDYWVRER